MATKTEKSEEAPDARFIYKKEGDGEYILFMSYALLNRLTRLCENIEKLLAISAHPELQEGIIAQLLAPTVDGKQLAQDFDLDRDTKGISPETIQEILMWAVGHMSHFFTGLMRKNLSHAKMTRKTLQLIEAQAQALMSQTDLKSGSAG